MKKRKINLVILGIWVIAIVFVMFGCASNSAPEVGSPTPCKLILTLCQNFVWMGKV